MPTGSRASWTEAILQVDSVFVRITWRRFSNLWTQFVVLDADGSMIVCQDPPWTRPSLDVFTWLDILGAALSVD